MKFTDAISKYRALSPEQKAFINNSQKQFSETSEKLLTFFKPLAIYDRICDEARAQLLNIIISFVVLSFLGIFVIAFMDGFYPVIAIELLFLVMTVLALILRWQLGKIDIHNNLREFVVPMVNLIGQDMAANRKITLDLDLRGKTHASKLKDTKKEDPGWLSYPKLTTSIYEDPWFNMTGELIDGSKVMLTVDDQITQIDRTYKGRSGKIKSKTKYKVKSMIKAGLALKHKNYAAATPADIANFGPDLKRKDGATRQVLCLKAAVKNSDVEANLDPQLCVSLLGKILMQVRPVAQKGS